MDDIDLLEVDDEDEGEPNQVPAVLDCSLHNSISPPLCAATRLPEYGAHLDVLELQPGGEFFSPGQPHNANQHSLGVKSRSGRKRAAQEVFGEEPPAARGVEIAAAQAPQVLEQISPRQTEYQVLVERHAQKTLLPPSKTPLLMCCALVTSKYIRG